MTARKTNKSSNTELLERISTLETGLPGMLSAFVKKESTGDQLEQLRHDVRSIQQMLQNVPRGARQPAGTAYHGLF